MFDDPGSDEVRSRINTIKKHLRGDGPFEPHRLPMDELEDITFFQVMDKLKGRWQPLPE